MIIYIRPALPAEAGILTSITIASKSHWKYPKRWMQIWRPALTISPEYIAQIETWVAIVEDKHVAYYSLKYGRQYHWLDNLWVLPAFMGQGLGSFLFNHALERSRESGALILRLEADPNAQQFYEKMGMYKVSERWTVIDSQPRVLPIMEIIL